MMQSYLKYISALILLGSNGIVASYIALDSYEIVLLRTLIGSLLLMGIFWFGKEKLTFYHHKNQFLFLLVSGMAMGVSWIFLYEAYTLIGVGIASLLYYCGPVVVMALSPLLFQEKLTLPKIIGFIVVLCGVWFVNSNLSGGDENHFGFICGILSALAYTVMLICNKKASHIKGLENAMLQLTISFLTVAVFVGLKQGFVMEIEPSNVIPIFILGLVNTGIGCYLYFSAIGGLPIQTVAIFGYLEPLSAVIFSVIILQETLSLLQWIGAVLIIGGAVFSEYYAARIKSKSRKKTEVQVE